VFVRRIEDPERSIKGKIGTIYNNGNGQWAEMFPWGKFSWQVLLSIIKRGRRHYGGHGFTHKHKNQPGYSGIQIRRSGFGRRVSLLILNDRIGPRSRE
jgi:hypothetical protein